MLFDAKINEKKPTKQKTKGKYGKHVKRVL